MSSHEIFFVAVGLIVVALGVIAWLEMKFMRRSMRSRRSRAAKDAEDLPDRAHNALVTTRAIAAALDRGGVRSEEVDGLLREAQMAYGRHNHRVVLDLTERAKEKLMALKARQTASGDAAKLDALPFRGPDEPTTKELLQKDFPPNLTQAKFTMNLASGAIEQGRGSGRDVAQAEALLDRARAQFEAQDFAGALSTARQAQRSAEAGPLAGLVLDASPVEERVAITCAACGAPVASDDAFCRKCGTRLHA
jgi:hypothetical protein